jgi:hypothetical protein
MLTQTTACADFKQLAVVHTADRGHEESQRDRAEERKNESKFHGCGGKISVASE